MACVLQTVPSRYQPLATSQPVHTVLEAAQFRQLASEHATYLNPVESIPNLEAGAVVTHVVGSVPWDQYCVGVCLHFLHTVLLVGHSRQLVSAQGNRGSVAMVDRKSTRLNS